MKRDRFEEPYSSARRVRLEARHIQRKQVRVFSPFTGAEYKHWRKRRKIASASRKLNRGKR